MKLSNIDRQILIQFSFWNKFRAKEFLLMLRKYKDFNTILSLNNNQLEKISFKKEYYQNMVEFTNSKDYKNAHKILDNYQIKTITFFDKDYPELLKEISSPPLVLFYKGTLPLKNDFLVSVVGTRKVTSYGRIVTEKLVSELCDNKIYCVSGLALGVDSIVAKTATEDSYKTFAILGNGLDQIYPLINKNLGHQVIKNLGAIISEFPPGVPALKQNFPQRNRIIAGISKGTIVIEAAEQSGSLITASFANQENRSVFAIPGPIFSEQSKGTNNLIKLGAKPVTSVADILEEFDLEAIKNDEVLENEVEFDNLEQEQIYNLLNTSFPIHVNSIAKKIKLDIPNILSNLMSLELKSAIKNVGAGKYIKNK